MSEEVAEDYYIVTKLDQWGFWSMDESLYRSNTFHGDFALGGRRVGAPTHFGTLEEAEKAIEAYYAGRGYVKKWGDMNLIIVRVEKRLKFTRMNEGIGGFVHGA